MHAWIIVCSNYIIIIIIICLIFTWKIIVFMWYETKRNTPIFSFRFLKLDCNIWNLISREIERERRKIENWIFYLFYNLKKTVVLGLVFLMGIHYYKRYSRVFGNWFVFVITIIIHCHSHTHTLVKWHHKSWESWWW